MKLRIVKYDTLYYSYNAVTKALRKVHDGPIFAICVLKDGSVVTGGGKDRRLVQFDASYRKSGLEAEVTIFDTSKLLVIRKDSNTEPCGPRQLIMFSSFPVLDEQHLIRSGVHLAA